MNSYHLKTNREPSMLANFLYPTSPISHLQHLFYRHFIAFDAVNTKMLLFKNLAEFFAILCV